MKRIILSFSFLLCFYGIKAQVDKLSGISGYHAANVFEFQEITFEQALVKARDLNKPVLLYINAKWNKEVIRKIHDDFFDKEDFSNYLSSNFVCIYVELTREGYGRALQHQLNIELIPAFIVFHSNGQEVSRSEGYTSADNLLAFIQDGHNKYLDYYASVESSHRNNITSNSEGQTNKFFDASAFDLKGNVKSCTYIVFKDDDVIEQHEYEFDRNGQLLSINGKQPSIKRDSKTKRITELKSDATYTFLYNNDGTIAEKKKSYYSFPLGVLTHTYKYEYVNGLINKEIDLVYDSEKKFNIKNVDDNGNWTKMTWWEDTPVEISWSGYTTTYTRKILYW